MEISKEKINTIKGLDGSLTIRFDSSRSNEYCDFIIKNGIKKISLLPEIYQSKVLTPLLPLKEYITSLLLDNYLDYTGLHLFKKLNFLSLPDNKKNIIDLTNFHDLEHLMCNITPRLIGLESCSKLKSLTINNYRPKSNDLSELPFLYSVMDLRFFQTKIISLNGIERFKNIKKFMLYSANKLESIEPLQILSNCLEEIDIDKCKNIKDLEKLGMINSLNLIRLTESGEIKSLAFVKELPNLNFLSFWGTNVLDGNINYCFGIDYVGFDNKRHYTHKSEEFKK